MQQAHVFIMKKGITALSAIFLTALLCCTGLLAQESTFRLLAKADSARLAYDFPAAVGFCQRAMDAMDSSSRSKAEELLILSQNGQNMMNYCSQPVVVAKQKFPLKDFFLFYPLKNRSWRPAPNQLDSLGGDNLSKAIYIPDGTKDIYYSAKDEDGIRNIYRTVLLDSVWSVPTLVNEQLTSSSDEIYPMLSADGKSLFFASKGLYGMGGYDLYVSRWNQETKDWDVPMNMGFPYSSPYDDFLYIDTEDGKYSIFASNRECGRDSVFIYVIEYDSMPVRKAISDVNELRKFSALAPTGDPSRIDNDSAVAGSNLQNAGTQRYMDKMKEVRALRDSVFRFDRKLNEMRSALASVSEPERGKLSSAIAEQELKIPAMNDSLSKAVKQLQDIEMEFLAKGVVIDPGKFQAQADKVVVGASSGYTFSKNSFGPAFQMEIRKPKPKFDYSFKILPEGRFAESNVLPEGLLYQIKLFTISRKAGIPDLKGLSPVFEKMTPPQKYSYSVGVFKSYKDVLSKLNKVKKIGFRSAEIIAFHDGESISVSKARSMESQVRTLFLVKIYPENGKSLPESVVTVIRQCSDNDLVKSVEAGSVVFTVGPFEEKEAATGLTDALKAAGAGNVSVEESLSE